jgi:hypothetical protein
MKAQRIACVNNAGFVMNFSVSVLNVEDGTSRVVGDSGTYPINQARVIDLANFGIEEGSLVRPHVNAVWGVSNEGNRYVIYDPDAATATYNVTGTTLNYSVNLL